MVSRIILLSLFLAACEAPHSVSVPFAVQFGDRAAACDSGEPRLSDLRFYLHDPALISPQGEPTPLQIIDDDAWQSDRVALIDLEEGIGFCDDGTTGLHTTLSARVPPGDYRGIEFTLGVPFELNHVDPLLAEPPLDDPAMHWHWRSGYKFLRAGVATETDSFWLHLGSTGCEGITGNISGCSKPNRVRIRLEDFRPGSHTIIVDLSALFASVDLDDGEPGDCSSGPEESACGPVLAALGLGGQALPVFRLGVVGE